MPKGYIFCPSVDRLEVEEPEFRPRQTVYPLSPSWPLHSNLTLLPLGRSTVPSSESKGASWDLILLPVGDLDLIIVNCSHPIPLSPRKLESEQSTADKA